MSVDQKHFVLARDNLTQTIQIQLSEKQMGRNIVAIWTAAALKYLLITVKVVAKEKVSFSDIKNPNVVC